MADKKSKRNSISSELLPRYFRTDANKKFLQATIDQLIQPGTVKKINGYVGRKNSKSTTGNDIFIQAADNTRQNYQLEPSFIVKDELGNTTFFKDYIDYINQLNVFGSNTSNHSRTNLQEFYSWDPHIDWDKFVNFQNYYWLPYGPEVIRISGQQQQITSTYTVELATEADNNVYVFSPDSVTQNPTIKLYRGQTYRFTVNSHGNPFSIKTKRTLGTFDRYSSLGLINNGIESGVVEFTVPFNSPDILYYVSEANVDLGGILQIASIDENTFLDIDKDFLGKTEYILPDGTKLSNGMKISFVGNIVPETYKNGQYYVEGVGSSIRLINESILQLLSPYTTSEAILFDNTPFDTMPWSDATSFAGSKDYIVINRSADDHNPWSRYNRWFHKDVIEASARYNGKIADIDQTARAVRPIIEFKSNIRLFNFGTTAIADVDVIDDYTVDVMSNVEGQLGYNIDGIDLAQGQRVLFTADSDIRVRNRIYKVEFLILDGTRQIHLVDQGEPILDQAVLVRQGVKNQGLTYWYNGSSWLKAQQKTSINQPPLFDIVNEDGISYGNKEVYDGSTFKGTKIFSYKIGSGSNDPVLGFPLSYKNINNVGDIVFNFDLALDSFQYKSTSSIITRNTNIGYLVLTTPSKEKQYINGWKKSEVSNFQAAIRIYKDSGKINNFDIDIFEDISKLDDLVVRIYINGTWLPPTNWQIVDGGYYKKIVLDSDIKLTDVLTIKAFANQPINDKGFYEIPLNLQNNPLNADIGDFTLGEVIDHVGSIVENSNEFQGFYPGASNLRDLGKTTEFGTRFVQHSGPLSLSLYHITSENNNIVRAIEKARDDYNKFKRSFVTVAENLGVEADPIKQVNLVMQELTKDKPKSFPYYFSDMVPCAGSIRSDFTVIDSRTKTYPLTDTFDLNVLSSKAVLVYLNGEQLLYKKDYVFDDQGFVVISAEIENDDVITIYEYESTNGCFVPPTPTKLGLYPKYEPKIFLDTTLVNPKTMIQGHDGSLTLAYGDYRDSLILELEKRIYNNIKVEYDAFIFDINDIVPAYNRKTPYDINEFNEVLSLSFYSWANIVDKDFTTPIGYDINNSLTFNYREFSTPDGRSPLPGYWRGVYKWMLGTDRPNLCPWEMLGFSEEPSWWVDTYGPAPYTSDNLVMWNDIADGLVKQPGSPPLVLDKFIRPYIKNAIPVDSNGNISSPLSSGLATGVTTSAISNDYVFGDISPVENAWRRSSYYSFSIIIASMLLQPAKTFGALLDRSRIVRNKAGQLVYKDTGLRIKPKDIVLPSIYSSTKNKKTSGIINYIVDYILSDNLRSYSEYEYDLQNISSVISHRLGGFTSKEKFKLLLDSKTPLTSGSVFVPQEDYDIILNSSSPVKKITYSGVIVTKVNDGFVIKGYSRTQPYFKYYSYTRPGNLTNVGGISESYSIWSERTQYAAGKIVFYANRYYRSKVLHTTTVSFDPNFYILLPSLPVIGGAEAYIRQEWDKDLAITIPYGYKLKTIQDVVDFLLGYGEWLKDQGFIFDDYNNALESVSNWETSAKEFMFWTTQNWSSGQDKWEEWLPNVGTPVGSIVRYNGNYYRALRTSAPSLSFADEDFVKLDGLSTVGSSVISLSPSALKLTFSTPLCVVDDIRNPFNGYEIFKVDGTPIQPNFLNNYREENEVSYSPIDDAIYGATFYLVQKEQVVVLKNSTLFNDTIYNPQSGYRQERIKVSGYVSSDWKGDFNIPGFIFDQAKIQEWESWKDYALGDIVKYKQFYYAAKTSLAGVEKFVDTDWIKLDQKPTAQMLPNWSYKASQFTDFYSLDSDNFDGDQQAVAQHLIGYQKRQYLSNIIQDDVSEFKFYQGMIVEKGTQNVLNKLFDVLSADGQESVKFYEEWAVRAGQYGANAAFENIEIILDEAEFKNNPQGFELVNEDDNLKADFIIRKTPNDVYVSPIGYNSNPWPVVKNYIPYLRTPGYVRSSDVKYTLISLDDILGKNISDFLDGDHIWVGFEGREWNVYRFSNLKTKVLNIEYANNELKITLSRNSPVSAGQIIGIDHIESIKGFYKIKSVNLRTITVDTTISKYIFTEQDKANVNLAYFTSSRASSIDTADRVMPEIINPGELLWTDNVGNNKWGTWEYTPSYHLDEIINTAPRAGLGYGRRILLNAQGNLAAVSTNFGEIIIYDKAGYTQPWIQRQTITAPFISKDEGFSNPTPTDFTGDVIAISEDGQWLASGTPRATKVCSKYKYSWSGATNYAVNDVVVRNSKYYKANLASGPGVSNVGSKDPSITVLTYNSVSGSNTSGNGAGATFNVTAENSDYTVTIVNSGVGYAVGNEILIFGPVLGGTSPANDLIIKVSSISGTSSVGPITGITVSGNAVLFWEEVPYIAVDPTGVNSNLYDPIEGVGDQGVVSIYRKDSSNIFTLVETILSPNPTLKERFGQSLVFGKDTLFIGAIGLPGESTDAGKVYRLTYQTIVIASTSYNPIGSSGTTVVLSSTTGIEEGMYIRGTGFTSNQYVAQVNSSTNSIIISAPPDSQPTGVLEFVITTWRYDLSNSFIPTLPAKSQFGKSMVMSADYSKLIISAPSIDNNGKVFVYNRSNSGSYTLSQTIQGTDKQFGFSLAVSDAGEYLAISSIYADDQKIDQGGVSVYKNNGTSFQFYQSLYNRDPETAELFGTKVSFMNDYQTLVVYSQGSDSYIQTLFDDGATTFDNDLTKILDKSEDSGRIDIYDRYNSNWIFSESLVNGGDISTGYSTGLAVGNDQILVGAPYALDQGVKSGRVHEYKKRQGATSWKIKHGESDRVDLTNVKRAFLYNRSTNKLITYLDVIDSTQGKIPGPADQEIKFKTFYDPAVYSSGNDQVNVDAGMAWTKSQVGTLWWDLRTTKFFDSHDTDLVYRNSTWNTLYPGATVDVYEWVETSLLPDQWNVLADTEEGIAQGISGKSLYDNTVYGLVRKYDNVAKSFRNTYYYWVKNKKTVPNVPNRKISAQDVCDLIENPRGYGYRYLALTGSNSFSLVNVKPLLEDKDVVLSIEYWTNSKTDRVVHSQWKIISNNVQTDIPDFIEQKWFDSLCGKDSAGRLVPDPSLAPKLKYGIEARPRQGMFVNRFEALKQVIEQVNRVLVKELIVENRDITSIDSYEKEPSIITGLYDSTLDTDEELRFANIGTYEKPSVKPIIVDGRIVNLTITQRGSGYLVAPYFDITGTGTAAKIRAVINNKGEITGATILNSGYGYDSNTIITVRNYSVLVHSDSIAQGNWSIYSYEPTTQVWSRVQSQSYDVRKYWNYIDWYASGYNEFTSIDYSVDSFVGLSNIQSNIGQVVKIRTTNLGTWLLLRKYADSSSIDWTQSYEVIGREKGTIQFSDDLYNFSDSVYGFDASLYDAGIFDNSASIELRIILNALKNNILIDTLKKDYLELFFSSIRYVFSEQNYVDWVFKTSFVKAIHNVGDLKQKITYNNDNLENFEDYINEVKPYRTQIREYVSVYDKIDDSSVSTTDFDLMPVFENDKIMPINTTILNGIVQADNNKILEYPWKHWYDNLGYSVLSIEVTSGGQGYKSEPVVRIVSDTGSGAVARAFITNGRVARVVVISEGSKYLSVPTIVLDGGLIDGGIPGRAIATIGDGKVRSNKVQIKFDRTTQKYFVNRLEETQTFTGTGSKLQFLLTWAPDLRIGKSSVKINGVEALRANYKLAIAKSTSRGYTSHYGTITFNVAPAAGAVITVNYIKDWSLLNAADRIQYYYDPSSGELGKDLAQLMTGVDYGGVNINGLGFDVGSGWGSVGYYTDRWDSFDGTFDDYIVTVAANTHSFTVPYVPPAGTKMNVYHSSKNVETFAGDGFTKIYNFNINNVYPPTVTVSTVKSFSGTTSPNVLGSSVIALTNVTGINQGDIVTITEPSGTITNTNQTGNLLTLSSAQGLVISEKLTIKGTALGGIQPGTYYVKTISGNNITISLTPGGVTFPVSTASGSMTFTTVSTFGLDTKVTGINTNTNQVTLDQVVYKAIKPGATVTFSRVLVDPTDCQINPNGTVFLNTAIPVGNTLTITAYFDPVRLDDENYNVTGVALQTLNTKQSELAVIINQGAVLADQKSVIESELETLNDELFDFQSELNALNIVLAGLNPGDPLYAPTVSQINVLTNTSIPNKQTQINQKTQDLNNKNQQIASNTTAKTTKESEVQTALTALNGLPPILNTTAIMQTPISDGVPDSQLDPTYKTFSIPGTYQVDSGDRFTWRKSTSDGSISPQEDDYDTALSGGDLAYSTASGIAADDIIVDGDGFVTPTSSPATEEVVPGQVVDAVAIKVYDRPNSGGASLKVDSYLADGVTKEFLITQQPNTPTAVIVKTTEGVRDPITEELSNESIISTLGIDYTVDYKNRLIKFVTAPSAGKVVSIFSFGFNGSGVLDLDYFIGDGVQTEFVTRAPWLDSVNYLVYVNGLPVEPGTPALFRTDSSYDSPDRIGIYFSVPPSNGALINYVIVSGTEQTYSLTKSERFLGNGTDTYDLQNIIGDSLPIESNMIVRAGQQILRGPNNSYFKITGTRLNYSIDPSKFLPYTLSADEVFVYADGNLLRSGIDYIIDISGVTVKIAQSIRQRYLNKELVVSVRKDAEYIYVAPVNSSLPKIKFTKEYSSADQLEVISSYKHDILNIQRTGVNVTSDLNLTPDTPEYYTYRGISGGEIVLDRPVLDDNYVLVTKNGKLLTPSVDYKLNEDRASIKLARYPATDDELVVITFGGVPLGQGISYMQFKDMLNRVHYKRLNANKRTKLVKALNYFDTSIELEDASNFDLPSIVNNKPGIIEIRGERIEYFTKNGNILGQLRRGTLGTGVPTRHPAASYVQDIGASETIPYTEASIIEQIKSDGTNIVPLTFIPMNPSSGVTPAPSWSYTQGFISTIPAGYKQANDIEVFVGGYTTLVWSSGVQYKVDDIVEIGSYTYRCVTEHTSSESFETDKNKWKFFVGNIRLKKKPYMIHTNNYPDSPEGDIQMDAEFAVDAVNKQLRLTHKLEFGTRVTVVKRTGIAWDSDLNILYDTTRIANFLKAAPGIWYANIGKYENIGQTPSSFDSTGGTFDSTGITFDQG